MKLQTNSIDTNSHDIFRTTRGGSEYLVAKGVTFGRPMYLDGGYVPSSVWKASVDGWEGIKLPVGHPLDENGNTIAVNGNEDVQEQTVVGDLRNPAYDSEDDAVHGDLWIDIEEANAHGHYGRRVIERLENGEGLEVSSAYSGPEADPGVYDGEYRHKVKAAIEPDHVALLPDDLGPGKCSRSEGCGITPDAGGSDSHSPTAASPPTPEPGTFGLAANAEAGGLYLTTDAEQVSLVTDGGEIQEGTVDTNQQEGDRVRWVGSDNNVRYGILVQDLDDDDLVLVAVYEDDGNGDPNTAGGETWSNTQNTVRVSPDSLERIEQFPPEPASPDAVDTNTDDVERLADRLFKRFEQSFPGLRREDGRDSTDDATTRAEPRSDDTTDPTPTDSSTMDKEQRIDDLVNNHGYKRGSLVGMGENCLERTHRLATNAADGGDGDGDSDGGSDPETNPDADPEDDGGDGGSDADDGGDSDPENDPDADPETDNDDRPEENGKSAEELAREVGVDDLRDELSSIRKTVEEREEYIGELERIIEERNQKEQSEHEALNEQIQSLTDAYDADTLEGMSKEQKEATISALSGSQAQMPGQQKSLATNGTDFGGLSAAQAHMNTNASEEEDDENLTTYGGSFGDALRNGGDD